MSSSPSSSSSSRATPLILEADAIFAQHPEIMVGELEIIFALDAVAGELRVTREAFVLLQQLRRIAALPIVLAIPSGLSPEVLSPLSPTTAPAAALSLIDQIPTSSNRSFPLWPQGRQASARLHQSLTLSFRSAPKSACERPIASGVERGAQLLFKGAAPVLSKDVIRMRRNSKRFSIPAKLVTPRVAFQRGHWRLLQQARDAPAIRMRPPPDHNQFLSPQGRRG